MAVNSSFHQPLSVPKPVVSSGPSPVAFLFIPPVLSACRVAVENEKTRSPPSQKLQTGWGTAHETANKHILANKSRASVGE